MAFVIAGHMRSGTSILRVVCQTHPHIQVTREFGNFTALNATYPEYRRSILGQWWRRRNGGLLPLAQLGDSTRPFEMLRNFRYVSRYLAHVRGLVRGQVNGTVIDQALRKLEPGAKQVGDKHPDYAMRLDELVRDEAIRCIFIYRDPRDVASSTVEKTRGDWRRSHPDELRDPRTIAGRWVAMMDAMERCRDRLLVIRYEDFVTDPEPSLRQLGTWLDVDPERFDRTRVRATSIGKYQQGLTGAEISDIAAVAGPAMQRYGYPV